MSAPRLAALGEALAEAALLVTPCAALLFLAPASGFGPEADRALALRALALLAAAGVLVAAWARGRAPREALRRPAPEAWLALVLLGVAALSSALAPDPLRSLLGALPRLDGALALAATVALFLATRALAADGGRRRRLARALVGAGAAGAAYALAQWAGVDPFAWGSAWPGRPIGAQGNPVFLAGALLLVLPFAAAEVAVPLASGRRRAAALAALPALAIALALVASRGRGALLGAAAGALIFTGAALASAGRRALARRLILGVAALGVALVLLPPLAGRPLPGLDPATGTARQRVLLWRATLELVAAHPERLLVGWGPESLALVLPRHLPEELPPLVWEPGRTQDRAHNATLDTLATLGLPGLAAAAALALLGLARPLARCGLGRGEPARTAERWLDAAAAAALAAHLVELQFGFRTAATGALAALLLGLATAPRGRDAPEGAAREPAGALVGWLAGGALALLAQAFATAPRPSREGALVLLAAGGAAALALWRGLPRRELLGRALPIALLALALGWGAGAAARGTASPGEAQAAAALAPLLFVVLGVASAVPRRLARPVATRRAAILVALAALPLLGAALAWSVARPLAAGVAFGHGRAALARDEADLAAAAFAGAAARAPGLVAPIRWEARAAASLAAATRPEDLRARRFAAALARLDGARARHPEDPDLDPESALLLARWAERTPDPAARRARLEEARARLTTAAERAPASASVARALAAVRLDLGDVEGARAEAERSAALAPRSLESALLLGRARAAAGDLEGALAAFGEAARMDGARAARLLESVARGAPGSYGAQRDVTLFALAHGDAGTAARVLARARAAALPSEAGALAALEAAVATAGAPSSEVE